MNCRRIEESIPLYVEGDLAAGTAETVSKHLLDCRRCAGVANDYRASQQWLKGYTPPDFNPLFFDELRKDILREINKRRRRSGFIEMLAARLNWNLAVATAVLALLFGATVSYLYLNRAKAGPQDEIANIEPDGKDEPPPVDDRSVVNPVEPLPAAAPHKVRRPRRVNPARPVRREALPVVAEGGTRPQSKDDGKLRIEIQTGDPNVRIIWFSPKSDEALSSRPQRDTN